MSSLVGRCARRTLVLLGTWGILALIPLLPAAEIPFAESMLLHEGDGAIESVADIDGDGDNDVIVTNRVAHRTDILLSGGGVTPSFTRMPIPADGELVTQTLLADVDGDSEPDLIELSDPGRRVRWLERISTSPLSFEAHVIVGPGDSRIGGAVQVAMGDLDGDGDLDLVVPSPVGRTITWFENPDDPAGLWVGQELVSNEVAHTHVVVGDIDGDGSEDLASVGAVNDSLVWALQWHAAVDNSPPQFVTHTAASMEDQYLEFDTLEIGDLDADGRVDLLSSTSPEPLIFVPGLILLYANLAGAPPVWERRLIGGGGYYPRDLEPSDLDADGDLDLAIAKDGVITWFDNLAPGGLERPIATNRDAAGANSVGVGDLDGDGDLDVIHTVDRPGTNEIRWHRNLFPVHVTGRFLDRSGDGVFMRGEPGLLEVSMCNLTGNTYTDIQIETLPQSDAIELEATQTTIDMIISHETTTVLIPFTLPPSGICGESFGADLILHLPVGDSLGEAKAEIGDSGLEVIATGRNEIIPIPDNDPEGLRYTLTVPPRGSTTVNDIDFLLEIEHAHIGDLSAVLTAPNGSQEIFSSFDPEDDGTVISVNSDLPAHDGLSPEGEWTLQVIDHAPGNTGNLTRFRLQIRYRFVDCAVWGEEELLRALLGLVPTSPLMDYNGDGVIDAADVVAVLGL